jgi:ribonuclease I
MNYKLILLLFSLFIHSSSATINFDYFMLAETWPASFCQMQTCISNIPSKFSIHGLWPKNNSSPHTSQCTTKSLREPEVCLILLLKCDILLLFILLYGVGNVIIYLYLFYQLDPLKPRIENVWLSLTGNDFGLWEHEWKVHGTCSTMPYDYFKLALDLHAKNDIKDLLQKKSITPGTKSIKKTDIENAIKSGTGGSAPQLNCEKKSGNLVEVRLCFDTSTNPKYTNCPTYTNCPPDVYLPL